MKAGYCAICGEPNVGKSTLQNGLLGQRLSIVTPKPQTTRHRVSGILTTSQGQVVFLDCPGIIEPSYELQSVMMTRVEQALKDADLIMLVVEATSSPREREERIVSRLGSYSKPLFLVVNKIDLVRRETLLPVIDGYQRIRGFDEVIPVSALTGDGLRLLLDLTVKYLPTGEPLYPSDQLTDHPERFFVSEIVREKVFLLYGDEIPYSTAVVVDEFVERPEKKDYIKATVFVERDSQKAILIGKKGSALREVGEAARKGIEEFLGRKVFLELWVKTRRNWRRKPVDIREFGY
jgi:GTP-binding protein Era